ncbi:unnamed protein product [Rhizoctonia solani]|uniref:Iminophenyl-pyruvate dimer synthase domain-containing protein n=1 Tax=Rhizoctonia solani TaxID=456999 RepID=A0A8H3CEE0_9AGAM|nr:unnamed protein product [Rhizoctonia solani]CAE6510743.1 unnamed protein product [Rhizoctonia solani]
MSQYASISQTVLNHPTEAPKTWTLDALRQHCQTAVILELYTIPLYLFALYSIDTSGTSPDGDQERAAAKAIGGIVAQEMLHLALAGNLCVALRGRPQLYGQAFAPKYPSELLYEGVLMTLAPARPSQIENFVEVEQPVDEKVAEDDTLASTRTLGQYESIGQFYDSLKKGKLYYSTQWNETDFFSGQLATISDLKTAEEKLTLIIEQGEGGPPPEGSTSTSGTPSHYEIFKDLSTKHLKVHKLIPNPNTRQFEGKETLHSAMLLFDAAYSYLLWSIELVWTYGGPDEDKKKKLKGNIGPLMWGIMKPVALFLVGQDLKTVKKKRAAPPFNLYTFSQGTSPLDEFKAIATQAEKDYPNDLKGIQGKVGGLFDLGNV